MFESRLPKKIKGQTVYDNHYALICKDGSLWMTFSNKDDAETYLSECPSMMPGDPMKIFKVKIMLVKE